MIEPSEMLQWLDIRIASARMWLDDFSQGKRKRPDHEIELKRKDIEHFEEIKIAYLKALQRKRERDGEAEGS